MSQGPSTSRNPGLLDFAAGPDGGPQGGRFQPICYERHPYTAALNAVKTSRWLKILRGLERLLTRRQGPLLLCMGLF